MSDLSLHDKLLSVEDDLLEALVADDDALTTFNAKWQLLPDELEDLSKRGLLDVETSALAHKVSSRVVDILSLTQGVNSRLDELRASFVDEVEAMFNTLTIDDLQEAPRISLDTREQQEIIAQSLTDCAIDWLQVNLINPYPSKKDKASISRSTEASVDSIDAWFRQVRRRIGWTSICRDYFSKSRKDTSKAARRALLRDDPSNPLESHIRAEFIKMQSAVSELHKQGANLSKRHRASVGSASFTPAKKSRTNSLEEIDLSTAPSGRSLPTSFEDSLAPTSKRKRGSAPEYDGTPVKRARTSPADIATCVSPALPISPDPIPLPESLTSASIASKLIPVQTLDSLLAAPSELAICHLGSAPIATPQPVVYSRKRRLSDSEGQVSRKRPHGQVKTRLHAVSDSIITSSMPPTLLWPNEQDFALASPASSASPDLFSTPLDVDFENWSLPTYVPPTIQKDDFVTPSQLLLDFDANEGISSLQDGLCATVEVSLFQWPGDDQSYCEPIHPDFDSFGQFSFDWANLANFDSPSGGYDSCPELDSSVTPLSIESPPSIVSPPAVDCVDLSDKLRKLEEHKQNVMRLEAEIAASTVFVA